MFILEHLYIWIIWEAVLTDTGKVGGLPTCIRETISTYVSSDGREFSIPERFKSCLICGGMVTKAPEV